MARVPSPWYRAQKDAWYVKLDGRQIRLAKGRESRGEAYRAFHALMADRDRGGTGFRPGVAGGLKVVDVLNLFLDARARGVERGDFAAVTLEGYERFLPPAAEAFGEVGAGDLRPHHVSTWADGRTGWGPTTRANAITAVKAAFRWAKKAGHIAENPIAELEKPRARRREEIPDASTVAGWAEAWRDEAGRDLLRALAESGCRPGEVYGLRVRDVDLEAGVWVVKNKTRHATGEETRTVYLPPGLVELTRRRVEGKGPEDLLFTNSRGGAWTRNEVACRFARLRAAGKARKGEGMAYMLRHLFATDGIISGVDVATLAELMGHKDPTMILRVYSKVARRIEHLRAAVEKVRPGQPGGPPSGPGSGRSDPGSSGEASEGEDRGRRSA